MYPAFSFENVGTEAGLAFLLALGIAWVISILRDRKNEKKPLGKVRLLDFPQDGVRVKKSLMAKQAPPNFHGRGAPIDLHSLSELKESSDQNAS